jgi:hypothetical protein
MNGSSNLKMNPPIPAAVHCSVDHNLRDKNVYYDDLISGNILMPAGQKNQKERFHRLYAFHWQTRRPEQSAEIE